VLILAATGVVARSLLRLQSADLALDPAGLLIGELAVRSDQYDDVAKQQVLLDQIMDRLAQLPEIRSASPVVAVPFAGPGGWDGRPAAEGQSVEEAAHNPMLNMEVVAPAYFATLGMPILRGRGFTPEDRKGSPAVTVISESVGRWYWPGQDPIGKRLRLGSELERTFTVVGIVRDTRYRDLRDPRPSIYFPLRQTFFPFAPMTLAIRTSAPAGRVSSSIRQAIAETAPGVALAGIAPFDDYLEGPLGQARLNALLLVLFGTAAVLLCTVGLYGAMATLVRQRSHELAVRLALGATRGGVAWMVISRALAVAGTGVIVGLLGAMVLNRNLRTVLYEIAPADRPTLTGVAVLILGVAAMASLLPARWSAGINPASALRAGE
jgi:predicted permease